MNNSKYKALSTQQKRCFFSAYFCLVLSVCCLVLNTGCLSRSLTIKTNPPGARVYVNDELKGQSPVTYDFTWYGWHRVMIQKDGYRRVDDRKLLRAPLYLWIPFDLLMELAPFPVRDQRIWSYDLVSAPELPTPVPPELLNKPKTPKPKPMAPQAQSPEPVVTVDSQPLERPSTENTQQQK